MNTVTYFSQNAPAGQEWLAQVFLPNGQKWLVHAYGATEAEAVEKIVNLYNTEKNKFNQVHIQITGGSEPSVSGVGRVDLLNIPYHYSCSNQALNRADNNGQYLY